MRTVCISALRDLSNILGRCAGAGGVTGPQRKTVRTAPGPLSSSQEKGNEKHRRKGEEETGKSRFILQMWPVQAFKCLGKYFKIRRKL